jgi:hypothetical protein
MKPPPAAGPALRVGIALLLCAACFQAGRWYQELAGSAVVQAKASPDPGNETVAATPAATPTTEASQVETSPPTAAGAPVGVGGDLITPLNVRDPSALVMGPAGMRECVPPPAVVPDPFAREAKPLKLKKGRLLELLKKADKKSDVPKNY